jgi:transcriptional repressor NF-X1
LSWRHRELIARFQLAAVYRMDTQLIDPEPHRSVQLIRRIDTRIPDPLLSVVTAPALGKLTDLRSRQTPPPPSGPSKPAATSSGPAWGRGWSSAVTRQPQPVASANLNQVTPMPPVRPVTPIRREQTASPRKAEVTVEPAPKVDSHVPDDWEEDV